MANRLKPTLYGKLHGRTVVHHAASELLNVQYLQFKKAQRDDQNS
jgi:hypothetical protein